MHRIAVERLCDEFVGQRFAADVRLMLVDGLLPAVIGLAIGLSLSAIVTREIQSLLYGTGPLDPTVFALVSLVLLLVAGAACVFPAWRASRLDPMQALRTE